MSDPLDELYQTIILDHSRSPRHFGRMEPPARCVEGYNPLCGDQMGACAVIVGDRFERLQCFGSGCAISKASASLMVSLLQGAPVARFYEVWAVLQGALKGDPASLSALEGLDDLAALAGVRSYPARVKCATLAWQALKNAIEEGGSGRQII
jgi:nitrogen fixation protein NifU and related proteins